MAAKSIISIEIQDGAWKSFNKQFEDHRAKLRNLPGQWGSIGKSINKAQGAAAKFVAKISNQAGAFKKANTFAAKLTLSIKASDRVASSLAKHTFKIAGNIKNATKSLLGWGAVMGLFSGLLGAGGLFGITRMAESVSSGQSSARRSGSSYGGVQAAKNVYGQLLGEGGVQSLLETMQREKASGGVMFKKVGMEDSQWRTKSPAQLIAPFLDALKKKVESLPAESRALSAPLFAPEGMQDYGVISELMATNLDALKTQMESEQRSLDLAKSTQQAWADFVRDLKAAGVKIENIFAEALVPLKPALSTFSEGLTKAIGVVMKSPMVKGVIAGSGEMLQKGANYLISDQFSADFKSFVEEIRQIGKAISSTAELLNKLFGDSEPKEIGWSQLSKEDTAGLVRDTPIERARRAGNQGGDAMFGRAFQFNFTHHLETPAGSSTVNQALAVSTGTGIGK